MERTLINEIAKHEGKKVLIKGSIDNIRDLGKIMFVLVHDRTDQVQVVVEDKKIMEELRSILNGSIVHIEATVSKTKATKSGFELIKPKIEIISKVTEPWPIEINKETINANIDTILDYRPLTLRHQRSRNIFKIQGVIVAAYREFLTKEGFIEFFGPNIISASSEGGSELFAVDYFGKKALLSQSAQLYKQMMVGVFERVFGLMKCYRAEKSSTRRHLTEATQFEFEMGFIENHHDVMDMQEKVIKYIVKTVKERCKKEIEESGFDITLCPEDKPFPRITFKDALQLVYERTGVDERNEIDLSPMAENELCKYAREEYGTDFIFVEKFLRVKTAFYAKPNEENPKVTNYFDLLCREIEISSGGQRISDHDELVESLKLKGLDPKDFKDYLSIFKYGMPKHGGFGLGMERLTMMLLGLQNIRECTLFPSDLKMIASVRIANEEDDVKDK